MLGLLIAAIVLVKLYDVHALTWWSLLLVLFIPPTVNSVVSYLRRS